MTEIEQKCTDDIEIKMLEIIANDAKLHQTDKIHIFPIGDYL